MKITSKRMVETEITEDYICNKCGNPCNNLGLLNKIVRGGYESVEFSDQDYYEFSLCEKCLKEIFATFIHPAFQYNTLDYFIPEDENK